MKTHVAFVLILVFLLVGITSAIPTTNPVTLIGNNNFTLNAAGCAASGCWFQYGINPSNLIIWTTIENPRREFGAPITTSTTYYAAACDETGCGNIVSFTTLPPTLLPVSTLGYAVTNMTQSKFNILFLVIDIFVPYAWLFPSNLATTGIVIVCGMLFFFIYVGFWTRQRGVAGPVVIGLITASTIMFSNRGLNLGIPLEFQAIAQALLYASMAGIFLIFLKK